MSPEGRQQLIALALGLVFIIGFVLLAQKIGQILYDRQTKAKVASGQISPTAPPSAIRPSPTPVSAVVTPIKLPPSRQPVSMEKTPDSIPNTGVETIVLVSIGSFLSGGYLLRRWSKS